MRLRKETKIYANMTPKEKRESDRRQDASNNRIKARAERIMEEFDALPPELREKMRYSKRGTLLLNDFFS